jgi:glycosyltransferase involved in cell wall biosynthesis
VPNSMSPWLGICVPTYNRPDALSRCMEMLIAQCAPLRVPIWVSDNASPYEFPEMMRRFQLRYELISWRRSEANLGMGANFLRSVELATTRYAWLFSDDDMLADGAVREVLSACERDEFDLIIANREYLTGDLAKDRGKVAEPIQCNETMPGGGALLQRACVRHYTFVGCLCFRASAWREARPARYQRLPYFPHLSILAEAMADPARKALFLASPVVLVRGGGYSWEKHAGKVWFAELQHCIAVVPGYSNAEKRSALWTAWRDIAQYALLLVAEHGTRIESVVATWRAREHYAVMRAYGLFSVNLAALLLSLLMPSVVLRVCRETWRFFRRPRPHGHSRGQQSVASRVDPPSAE